MNTLKHFIAIDLGATSGRVILATLDQQGIATDVVHRFRTPMLELEPFSNCSPSVAGYDTASAIAAVPASNWRSR